MFRKRRGKENIYPQHRARIAAYCQLLEESEGGHSPYGVVLFGSGHDGLTVPNTAENRKSFADALRDVWKLMEDVQKGGLMPDIPKPASVCHDCPLGRSHAQRPGESETQLEGSVLQPYRTRGEDNIPYHSICGDRFRWVPPHDRAMERGLC